MNKWLLSAVIALVCTACANEEYVGDKELQRQNESGKPISFSLISAPVTREVTGADAAALLNNNFVVYGTKSSTQTIFDNYQVNYVSNSANTTTTNSAGWEYVGFNNSSGIEQSIKFWDYSANWYDFFAYSLGKGASSTYATASKIVHNTDNKYQYSLSGTSAQLAACYISDMSSMVPSASGTEVKLQFRELGSKVKIAFYETIPGYSVKDVKFYQSGSVESGAASGYGTTAYLYASSAALPNKGEYTISFTPLTSAPSTSVNTASTVAWNAASTDGSTSSVSFGDAVTTSGTTWTGWAAKEYKETEETVYIGRSSSACTASPSVSVLPNPAGTPLYLKVDYTLLSRDGLGETIEVKGATATIPAAYTAWKPGYSYTYLFKISDNTNGTTGQSVIGLSPIKLDAVVNTDADGEQETITTVTEPSITTYQKGSNYATTDEYKAGIVYVVVGSGTELTVGTNAKLYTVTNTKGSSTSANPAQGITEATVANALTKTLDGSGNYTVTDANGWTLTVSPASGLEAITEIPAAYTPDGNAITINGAKFTATAGTTYVFEYIDTSANPNVKYYKVIKVANNN